MTVHPTPRHYIDALEHQRNSALNDAANAQAMVAAQSERIEDLLGQIGTLQDQLRERTADQGDNPPD